MHLLTGTAMGPGSGQQHGVLAVDGALRSLTTTAPVLPVPGKIDEESPIAAGEPLRLVRPLAAVLNLAWCWTHCTWCLMVKHPVAHQPAPASFLMRTCLGMLS